MAKASSTFKLIAALGIPALLAYGFKTLSDKKNAFKLLRIGVASANSFSYRIETNSIEFALTLLLQNLGSFNLLVKDFAGKAFVNGKEFGFIKAIAPIEIKSKSESRQTIYLSIPAQNLIREVGLSVFQIINKSKNKKVLSHAIKFEGVATLSGNIEVPVDQTINI